MFEDFLLSLQGIKNNKIMSKDFKKVSYKEVKSFIDLATGEVIEQEKTRIVQVEREPDFAKMYFTDLINLMRLEKTTLIVLLCMCREMGYNNVVTINKSKKERLSKELNISVRTIEGCILKLNKVGFMIRINNGEYLIDPNLFARGKWEEIKGIRLIIDYNPDGTRTIRSNVMKNMEEQGLRE